MHRTLLIQLLSQPHLATQFKDEDWNQVIQTGRQVQLLGQVAASLDKLGLLDTLPWRVARALKLDLLTARKRSEAAMWEIETIRRALPEHIPLILLKGCAYALAEDRNSDGRLFSDVDLLIPLEQLDEAESALVAAGWKPSQVSAYDQKYYRSWMHEIPPMSHVRRHTTIDLHHAIIPPVSRYAFNADLLMQVLSEKSPGIFVLSPEDRVIHSSVHAFLEGVPKKALRDLYDIFCLLQQYFPNQEGKAVLYARATSLGLLSIVEAAIQASEIVYGSGGSIEKVRTRALWLANAALTSVSSSTIGGRMYEQLLLAHSHWMKMPFLLLIPHLARKSWLQLTEKNAA